MNTPKEPTRISGVPHFKEMGEKNYLSAYYKLSKIYNLNDLIKLIPPTYNPFQEVKEYSFYIYELQTEAFNEVLIQLSKYNYKDLSINIYDRFGTAPNIEYFQNLFDLVKNIETLKK